MTLELAPSLANARAILADWAWHRPLDELAREVVRVDLATAGVSAPALAVASRARLVALLPQLEAAGDGDSAMLASRGWEMLDEADRAFRALEHVSAADRGPWHLHRFARLAHLAGDTLGGRDLLGALVSLGGVPGAGAAGSVRTLAVEDARIAPALPCRWQTAPRAEAALQVHHAGASQATRVSLIADAVDADCLEHAEVIGRYMLPVDTGGVVHTSGHITDLPLLFSREHWVLDTVNEVGRMVHVAAANHHGMLVHVPRPRARRFERALLLGNNSAENFFHWMGECLPRLALLDALPDGDTMPLVAPGPLRRWQADSLRLLGVDPARVVNVAADESIVVDRLWLVRSALPQSAPAPASARYLRERLGTTARPSRPRRLYLQRTSGMRRVLNEADVIARYRRAGFDVVRPEELSVADQVALFREAVAVAGTVGASFTGLAFAPPGTRAIASNARVYLGPCYVAMAHWLDQEMHALVGTEAPTAEAHPHWDLTLDLDDVDHAIAAAVR